MNEHEPENSVESKAEEQIDLETAISELEKVTEIAHENGRTPLEQITIEFDKGNKKPREAYDFLVSVKAELEKRETEQVGKEETQYAPSPSEPSNTSETAKKIGNFATQVGINYVANRGAAKITDVVTGKSKYLNAWSEINTISQGGKFSGDSLFQQVAIELLKGNNKPLGALEFLTAYQQRMKNPVIKFVTSPKGEQIARDVARWGIRKLIRLIFGI